MTQLFELHKEHNAFQALIDRVSIADYIADETCMYNEDQFIVFKSKNREIWYMLKNCMSMFGFHYLRAFDNEQEAILAIEDHIERGQR